MRRLTAALTMVFGLTAAAFAQTPAATGTTNMDILRQKIKADKKLVVAENLKLTDAEGTAFSPVDDAYQKDLEPINPAPYDDDRGVCRCLQQGSGDRRRGEEASRRGARRLTRPKRS